MRHLSRNQALGLAAVIALIVSAMVYVLLNSQARPPEQEAPQMVTMVVAEAEIGALQTITSEMVGITEVARPAAPPRHLSRVEDVIGKVSQRSISHGEAITALDVAARSAARGLTFVIPEGMRAATVALDPVSGVAGFALPGDRVDVLTTFERDGTAFTRTILQDITVLAIGQASTRPQAAATRPAVSDGQADPAAPAADATGEAAPRAQEEVRNATLAVTPDEAQSLILAAATGAIHLVLRPPGDASTVALPTHADWQMMGLDRAPQEAREEPQPPQPEYPMMAAGYPPIMWPQEGQTPPQVSPRPPEPTPAPAEPVTVEVVRGGERELVSVQ
ncbi:MAG: Flp pilus assembly protein CpaB [Armatimonadota bacterium]|jgi:pilus assembly protein CpaB